MMVFEIDGNKFSTLEEFYSEVSRVLIPGAVWGYDLDAFNDILRGGFGTPDEGFTLLWRHHEISKEHLGYEETIRQLDIRLAHAHPTNRQQIEQEIETAKKRQGPTVFDWLVEIIQAHGPDGLQAQDKVTLVLE